VLSDRTDLLYGPLLSAKRKKRRERKLRRRRVDPKRFWAPAGDLREVEDLRLVLVDRQQLPVVERPRPSGANWKLKGRISDRNGAASALSSFLDDL